MARAVDLSNSIDIGDELIAIRERADHLQLKVFLRAPDADAIVLGEFVEQVDTLMDEFVPRVSLGIFKSRITVGSPFLEQDCSGILAAEVGCQGLFKAAAKNHGGPGIFLLPPIQIAIPVSARAAEILADLRVAKDHDFSPCCHPSRLQPIGALPNRLPVRRFRDSETTGHCVWCEWSGGLPEGQ